MIVLRDKKFRNDDLSVILDLAKYTFTPVHHTWAGPHYFQLKTIGKLGHYSTHTHATPNNHNNITHLHTNYKIQHLKFSLEENKEKEKDDDEMKPTNMSWLITNRLIRLLRLEGNGSDYNHVVECCKSCSNKWSHPEDPLQE